MAEPDDFGIPAGIRSVWRKGLLRILKEAWPEAILLRRIYAIFYERHIADSPDGGYYTEPWKDNLQPRYQCWIRSELNRLKKDNLASRVGRGEWKTACS